MLTNEEVLQIPEEISSKLREFLNKSNTEKLKLSSMNERHNVDLEETSLELQTSQKQVQILESTKESLSNENAALRSAVAELQATKTNIELKLGDTESNRETLTSLLEKREKEVSECRDELALMKSRCDQLNAELGDARIKQTDAESSKALFQSQLTRKESECTQLMEEHYRMDSEKLAYMRQISRLQMDKNAEVSNHQHSVETIKHDLSNTRELMETYKQQSESLTERLRQEQARHRECRDNFIAAEEAHRQELFSQKKLTNMYKEAEHKASSELEDIHKTASEYKECYQQLTAEHEASLAEKQSEIDEIRNLITSKDEHITQIESELSRMDELVKESSESPDVTAELAKLIKSGLTYSQLYHKYHQTAEQLTLSRAESNRLNESFNTLVKEIDVMKPQVVQLRAAHEASSGMVQKLSDQLRLNLQSLDEEAQKANEAKKQLIYHQKESHKFAIENEDLSTQIQILIKELHIAKGGTVIDSDSSTQVTSTDQYNNSADVISTQLVSFRDIQELQKQNQQLRAALREVSEAHDKSERDEESSQQSAKHEHELANYRQEVEHLKQSRLKQEELVQSVIKQRDMYKGLVAEGAMKEAQAKASPRRLMTEVDNEKLRSLNDELKTSKANEARVAEELQKCRKDQAANESKLYDQISELNKSLTEQKLSNAKLSTQLDYSLESSKVIEKNVTGYKQEISALRAKAEQYSKLLAKNESVAASLRQDVARVQQSSIKYEVANSELRNEIELLKVAKRRLEVDADAAKKDYNLQMHVLANLQTIQGSIEASNKEVKAHYQQKIEYMQTEKQALEKQLATLKDDLSVAEKHHSAKVLTLNSQTASLEQELKDAREKLFKLEELNRQMPVIGEDEQVSKERHSAETDVGHSQDLQHANSKIQALEDQLRLSSEACDEYKTVADKLELTLREQATASQKMQESLELKNNQLHEDVDRLTTRVKDLTHRYDTTFEEKCIVETEFAEMKTHLTSKLSDLEANLSVYKEKLESKERVEAQARADLQHASALNEELTRQGQAELERSSKLLEEVSSIKEERDSLTRKLQELESDVMKVELQLQSNHASFEAREKDYKTSLQSLEQELSNEKGQTRRLHEQIEYFSRKHVNETAGTSDEAEGVSEERHSASLFELVKILRSDKELYERKLDVALAESKRLQAKVTFTEGELNLARGELAGERSQASIDMQTKAQHAELLRKIEQINVLTESNRMLRQEKDSLQPKIDRLEKEVLELQTSLSSLESKSAQLTMFNQNLEGEKVSLQKTVEHWKQRSSMLVEKHNREKADESTKHGAEIEQMKKSAASAAAQIQRLNNEVGKLKASITSAEEEKEKLNSVMTELQNKLSEADAASTKHKEEVTKKDSMINELKRLGRSYKNKYTKLLDESKALTASEEAKTTTGSALPSTSDGAKLQTELATLKETVTAQDEEISSLKANVEQLKSQAKESQEQLEHVQQELAMEKDNYSKASAELKDVTHKHTTLKEFVGKSLKPKVQKQKDDIEKKQKEISAIQLAKQELELQLEESQAKLFSLIGDKSVSGPSGGQTGHTTGSTETKRSQVRTIEVRPMSQPPKQPTATVMPTPNQSEPQEAVVLPTTSQVEPQEAVVLPTTSQVEPQEAVVLPTTSQVEPQEALVLPTTSQSEPQEALVLPTTSQSEPQEALVLPTTSQSEPQEALVLPTTNLSELQEAVVEPQELSTVHEEPMVGIVSPTSIASPSSNAISTSGSDGYPVTQLVGSTHSPVQMATSSTPMVSAASRLSVQPLSPQASHTSVVSPQTNATSLESTDMPPAGSTSSIVPFVNTASPLSNAVTTSAAPLLSHVAAVVASQSAALSGSDVPDTEDRSRYSSLATSSTHVEGTDGHPRVSNEAEVSRGKRSRDEYEADEESDPPIVKRSKEEESTQEAEDQTSQSINTLQEDFVTHEYGSESLPSSSIPHLKLTSAPAPELSEHHTEQLGEELHDTSAIAGFAKNVPSSNEQVADRSTAEADVIVIVSSDEDEAEPMQNRQELRNTAMEDRSESEMEPSTEGEDSNSEYEEEQDVQGEGLASEEEDGGEGIGLEEEEAYEEEDDDGSSDIITIDEQSSNVGSASASVSSSQPSMGTDRRMTSHSASLHYQSQGTVSMESNANDDGIVPSTPTLALPVSRNDGFAVAVSSPNPSHDPFIFASSAVPSAGFGDLAQQATIMDDLPQIGDSIAPMAVHSELAGQESGATEGANRPVGSTSALNPVRAEVDSVQMVAAGTDAAEILPDRIASTPSMVFCRDTIEMPTESTSVVMEAPTGSPSVQERATTSTSAMDLPTASTSSEQSNVVSTDSDLELHSSAHSRSTTEEMVSSSEANERADSAGSFLRSETSQSGGPDMPSSSGQPSRFPTARRGRGRTARLNRPSFNKPK
ncbi:nucleoprotein TPR-like [Watersipora subatra]|uniref:nucleoprotein TPR-like n=1 Tax=Watersipora subatra TaxID=2589382 RepID=UPI00355BA76C